MGEVVRCETRALYPRITCLAVIESPYYGRTHSRFLPRNVHEVHYIHGIQIQSTG